MSIHAILFLEKFSPSVLYSGNRKQYEYIFFLWSTLNNVMTWKKY